MHIKCSLQIFIDTILIECKWSFSEKKHIWLKTCVYDLQKSDTYRLHKVKIQILIKASLKYQISYLICCFLDESEPVAPVIILR